MYINQNISFENPKNKKKTLVLRIEKKTKNKSAYIKYK